VELKPTPGPAGLASLQLMEQARVLLERNKPDEAIRILERAVSLHPTNGGNYYYLAEAWLRKGNVRQAREFSGLAVLYLRDHGEWTSRLRGQEERISRGSRE
jgi:predicted Zn-dependent protease